MNKISGAIFFDLGSEFISYPFAAATSFYELFTHSVSLRDMMSSVERGLITGILAKFLKGCDVVNLTVRTFCSITLCKLYLR